jgi:hypothetical protein
VGIFNSHNEHIRGKADPHAALFTDAKNALSSTFGRELLKTFLIACYLLLPRLLARIYWVFLEEILPELLEEIPLALSGNTWLQHIWAATHIAR